MPVVSEEELASKKETGRPRIDLSPYTRYLATVPLKSAGHISLSDGEKRSTIKRHINLAAKEMGHTLAFHRSGPDELLFEVLAPDSAKPARRGGRPKKTD